jgi:glycogen debranching enzyme
MRADLPHQVHLGRDLCGDLAQAERREWWLANGRGGYAGGTIATTLTRSYHGLLIAPLVPPLGRYLVVTRADATLVDGAHQWPLFANRWSSGAIEPRGHVHIESFHLDGRMPVWTFAIGALRLEQRIGLAPGAETAWVAWRLIAGDETGGHHLRVRILANGRDHHDPGGSWSFDPVGEPLRDGDGATVGITLQPLGEDRPAYRLHLVAEGGAIEPERTWIEAFDLPAERERGLAATDRHLAVATAHLDLSPRQWVGVVATLEAEPPPPLAVALSRCRDHDAAVLESARAAVPELRDAPPWVDQLVLAADAFLFARPLPDLPEGESVIAGYPWFGDWGRDTMIALPGLTLAAGRHRTALHILEAFARFVDRGMVPNHFPGRGEAPRYNSVDAALWYVEAWRAYVAATGDREALARIWPLLEEIIDWYRRGTRHGISLDPVDGLLRAGEPGVQLTWMDAKVGDWVVTPRQGKAVEVNALWCNALATLAEWADDLGRDGRRYRALAAQAQSGFQRFVKPAGGLWDVLDGPDGADPAVRPNQILAVSIAHSPLDRPFQARVVAECGSELLTSYGLRSLSPTHPDYCPRYSGGVRERDAAYHQGTVWAWLLGPYALAHHRVHGDPVAAQALLAPIADHLRDAGLGTVSEIFDGDPPHTPRGAPAQAWSVGCILEAWVRLEQARHRATGAAPRPHPATGAVIGHG